MPNKSLAQIFVVVRNDQSLDLQRIPVTATLQSELAADFLNQMNDFVGNKTQVGFSPSYQPEKDELLQISSYAIPPFLQQAASFPHKFQLLTMPFTPSAPIVKAILVAIPSHSGDRPEFLFKYFDRRRILNIER